MIIIKHFDGMLSGVDKLEIPAEVSPDRANVDVSRAGELTNDVGGEKMIDTALSGACGLLFQSTALHQFSIINSGGLIKL